MPRILLVGDINPYGRSTGAQQRLKATARGLARVGEVDYLQWGSRPWRRHANRIMRVPARSPFARHVVVRRRRLPDRLGRIRRALSSWSPIPAVRGERRPFAVVNSAVPNARLVREALGEHPTYDLVWCYELTSALAALPLGAHRMVVDIDAVPYLDRDPVDDDRFTSRDRAAWERWIDIVARESAYVTFANPIEAVQLQVPNRVVVPNGCDVPRYRGVRPLGHPPVFVFVGWMGYVANADAARYLVHEIVPALRTHLGEQFLVRLVGSAPPEVQALAQDPNVEVVGYVDDLDDVLTGADVALVPVRRGAGTRIKVLEAFAAQVPVVSTAFGAQGLSVVDGEHLLLAETPRQFAEACARLLTNSAQREHLVAMGYELVTSEHAWPLIEAKIGTIAEEVIGPRPAERAT